MAQLVCGCAMCRVRSVRSPLLVIAAGVLFSLDLIWRTWPFSQTWPVLLILWGLMGLAMRMASDEGHGNGRPPAPSPPPSQPPTDMPGFLGSSHAS